jgi:hypothetical protein
MFNLLPTYQDKIAAHEFKTTDELLAKLRAIENNLSIMPKRLNRSISMETTGRNAGPSESELVKEVSELKQAMQRMEIAQRNQQRINNPSNRFMQSGNAYPPRNQYNFQQGAYRMPEGPRNMYQQQAFQPPYQPPRRARLPDGRPVCDYCGIPGHIMRFCGRYNRTRNPPGNVQYQGSAPAPPQIDARGETNQGQGKDSC